MFSVVPFDTSFFSPDIGFGFDKGLDLFVDFCLQLCFLRVFGQSMRQQGMCQAIGQAERLGKEKNDEDEL